jgi:SprT protein
MKVGDLRDECRAMAEKKFKKAEKKFGRDFIRPKRIEFSSRMTSLGGCACFQENVMRINLSLLEAHQLVFAKQIVPHEVAHLVCDQIHGTIKAKTNYISHGEQWRGVMVALGEKPERCHTFRPVKKRNYKNYKYVSECGEHCFLLKRDYTHKDIWHVYYRAIGGNKTYLFKLHSCDKSIPDLDYIGSVADSENSFVNSFFIKIKHGHYRVCFQPKWKWERFEALDVDFI